MHTILVIDDDQDIAFIVSAALEKEGYKVFTSLHPLNACEIINDQKVDLLLMDINLQGFDGRDVCKSLKANQGITIPIVLFSAGRYTYQAVQYYLADGFISKPFDLNELKQTVLNHLNTG